jgi:hypothetical protein
MRPSIRSSRLAPPKRILGISGTRCYQFAPTQSSASIRLSGWATHSHLPRLHAESDILTDHTSQDLISNDLVDKIFQEAPQLISLMYHRKDSCMRAGLKVALTAALVGLTTIMTVTPASADQWPFDGIPPDKSTHSYCYTTSVTDEVKSYIPGAMNYLNTATNIPGVPFHSPCETTNSSSDGTPATDVAWFVVWVEGAYGQAECKVRTASDPSVCDQRHTRINSSMIKTSSNAHHQFHQNRLPRTGAHGGRRPLLATGLPTRATRRLRTATGLYGKWRRHKHRQPDRVMDPHLQWASHRRPEPPLGLIAGRRTS